MNSVQKLFEQDACQNKSLQGASVCVIVEDL